jgi:hypothetical protein
MRPVWEKDRSEARFRIAPGDVLARVEAEIPLPHAVVWGLLLDPKYRSIVFGLDRQEPSRLRDGRVAEGSVYTCYHGRASPTTQTILALDPLRTMLTEDTTPIPGARIFDEIELEPKGDSTVVTITTSRGRGPWLSRFINDLVGRRLLRPRLRRGLDALRQAIERELDDGSLVVPTVDDGGVPGRDEEGRS